MVRNDQGSTDRRPTRRAYLAALGAAGLTAVAGCTGGGGSDTTTSAEGGAATTEGDEDGGAATTATTSTTVAGTTVGETAGDDTTAGGAATDATGDGATGNGSTGGNESTGNGSEEFQKTEISGDVPQSVETQYWHDWKNIDADSPPLEYTAEAGAALDSMPIEFSSEDDPWMREHALMIQRGVKALGIPVTLNDRPLNQLYAQSWNTPGLEAVISMSTHGPDPQRGLDPNPLLMRRYKENPSNYDNYFNPRINDLLVEQRSVTEDVEKRKELVAEVQSRFTEDVGALITLFPDVITAANKKKWKGYVNTPGNGPTKDSFQWTEINLQPQAGSDTYVKGVTTSMNSLNLPWSSGGAEEKRLKFVYDGLYDATPDLKPVPALATGGGFVDETTVELDLRKDVKWHDGEDFTAEDVKFTVDLYTENSSTSQTAFYEPIESAEVLGDHKVRFNLEFPDAAFMTQRVVRSVIIPKHTWKDVDNPSQYNPDNPIGTGPFKFENWDQGSRFEVSRNDGHWMFEDSWRQENLKGQAVSGDGIKGVVWINVGNVDSLLGAISQGKVDAAGTTLSNQQAERASNTTGIEKMTAENFAPLDNKLMFSTPLVRDKEFRIALSKAVDNRGFVDSVLGGRANVPKGENPISKLTQWYSPDTTDYGHDVDEAKSILKKAGYTMSGGSLQYPSGDAWRAFVERIQNGNTHRRREQLGQSDFS